MTFSEAAMIMMSGEESGVIKSLSVIKNGVYQASGEIDGYNPVNVNVPDRYEEGFSAGEKSVTDKIGKLTVTANGIYTKDEGGYNPVEVNVRNGYDEGYADGCIDTEANILNDPNNPTHIAIRENGFNDGYEFANAASTGDPVTRGNVSISVEVYPYTGERYTSHIVASDDVTVSTTSFFAGIIARTFVDGVEKWSLNSLWSFAKTDWKFEKWYVENYDNTSATLYIQYRDRVGTTSEYTSSNRRRRDIYKAFV